MTPEQMKEALADLGTTIERHFGKGTPAVLVVVEENDVNVIYPKGVDALAVLSMGLMYESGAKGPAAMVVQSKVRKPQ